MPFSFLIMEKIFFIDFLFSEEYNGEKLVLKVINMNLALSGASKYFFSFSATFYFSYAYFAVKKLLVRA